MDEYINLEEEKNLIEKEKIKIITFDSKNYPSLLKEISSPPVILYYKGEIPVEKWKNIGIVGTRTPSPYGKLIAEKLSTELSSRGITIVSGMARGIDTHAHKGAIEGGGKTIAVLGSGLLRPYPPENKYLMEKIISHGAVISEYPLHTPPWRFNFPRRNRIISGLSVGVIVVEARRKSGALITASLSLEQGREVFAIPGKINSPLSEGTHYLIHEGGKLIRNWEDVWEEFSHIWGKPHKEEDKSTKENLSQEAGKILKVIKNEPLHIDEISQTVGIPSSKIYIYLMELSLKGRIKELPGKFYVLK